MLNYYLHAFYFPVNVVGADSTNPQTSTFLQEWEWEGEGTGTTGRGVGKVMRTEHGAGANNWRIGLHRKENLELESLAFGFQSG